MWIAGRTRRDGERLTTGLQWVIYNAVHGCRRQERNVLRRKLRLAHIGFELERNRPAESIALCDRALKLNAEDTAALLARGLALLRSDNPTDAAATLAKIPRSAVEYSRALYLLARAYRQSRQIERADATLREFRALEAASEQSTTPARKKPR